jgi:hypothetical protein
MTETFHSVGPQDYKVDHVAKKVYKKQLLPAHIPPQERAAHPEGYTWLPTGGDYGQFVAKHSAPVSPVPVVEETVVSPTGTVTLASPEPESEEAPPGTELLSTADAYTGETSYTGKKLSKK